jgi:hypothetical protein
MNQRYLTLLDVEEALSDLGGEADWKEIETRVMSKRPGPDEWLPYKDMKNCKGTMRQIVQDHCASYKKFNGDVRFIKLENSDGIRSNSVRYKLALSYQEKVQSISDMDVAAAVSPGPQPKPELLTSNGRKYYPRNHTMAAGVLARADYKCEISPSHISFTTKENKNYVEAHHLIPFCKQEEFGNSLDVAANVVALCPNCHRLLHLATPAEKEESLKMLHKRREDSLKQAGIEIGLTKLMAMYQYDLLEVDECQLP